MLKLTVIMSETFNEATSKVTYEKTDIELEHSLASLSKWEMIWEVPLLSTIDKTQEQTVSYIECMCITPNIAPEVFQNLDQEQFDLVGAYLEKKQTATWFSNENPQAKSGETITSELIYFWMSSFQIDWEAQHWPLNRLLTLVKVFSVKQDNKPKKINQRQRQMDIASLNARRKRELGTNG